MSTEETVLQKLNQSVCSNKSNPDSIHTNHGFNFLSQKTTECLLSLAHQTPFTFCSFPSFTCTYLYILCVFQKHVSVCCTSGFCSSITGKLDGMYMFGGNHLFHSSTERKDFSLLMKIFQPLWSQMGGITG